MVRRITSRSLGQNRAELVVAIMFLVIASSVSSLAASMSLDTAQANLDGPANKIARGLIRSSNKTELRTELQAPVALAPFKAGQEFELDDTLIAFDCDRYEAELQVAKASANAAWIEYKSKKRLLAHQAIGKDEVKLAAANANRTSLEAEVRKVINSDCEIKAPFKGRVVESNAGVGEYATSDKPLMIILDDANLEIEILVPSKWLVWLKQGQELEFVIDETNQTVLAKVSRLGAEIDPVSRTIKIYAVMKDNSKFILSGMSGQAVFTGGS